jgi:hypothetical protein
MEINKVQDACPRKIPRQYVHFFKKLPSRLPYIGRKTRKNAVPTIIHIIMKDSFKEVLKEKSSIKICHLINFYSLGRGAQPGAGRETEIKNYMNSESYGIIVNIKDSSNEISGGDFFEDCIFLCQTL